MGKIKATFRNVSEQRRLQFHHSTCLLTISVGQQTHEDERFIATMKLIHSYFKDCIITLHDSLQRYTIALDQEQDETFFHDFSVSLGDRWLARNKSHCKMFDEVATIIRWDEWLANPQFEQYKNKIIHAIGNNERYRMAFQNSIEEYLKRYCSRLENVSDFNYERARKLCYAYLIEECAVLCLWPQSGCQYELYAGKHNLAMKMTRELFIKPFYENCIQSIEIGFNKRPDLKPQQFIFEEDIVVA